MALFFIILTLLIEWPLRIHGYAKDMCGVFNGINWCPTSYMNLNANLGTMGTISGTVDSASSVQIFRVVNGVTQQPALNNNDPYLRAGDTLLVKISKSGSYEVVYQATGTSVGTAAAQFTTTTCCTGTRQSEVVRSSAVVGAKFTITSAASGPITFWAAWSTQKGGPNTFLTAAFTLTAPAGGAATIAPTASSTTGSTTAPSTTVQPSFRPTAQPTTTVAPTTIPSSSSPTSAGCNCNTICQTLGTFPYTAAPTIIGFGCNCNCQPTPRPSAKPTLLPSSNPTNSAPTRQPFTTVAPTTGTPTLHPTLHSDRYTIQSNMNLVNLTKIDFMNFQVPMQNFIAGALGIDVSLVFVFPTTLVAPGSSANPTQQPSHRSGASMIQRRLTSDSFQANVVITGISSLDASDKIRAKLDAYLQTGFYSDLKSMLPNVVSVSAVSPSVQLISDATAPMTYSCELSDIMTFSWTILSPQVIRARISTTNPQYWVSFGLILPAFLMAPAQVTHNVFIFSPFSSLIGRYDMRGITAASMYQDASQRLYTGTPNVMTSIPGHNSVVGIVNIQTSPKMTYLDVDMSTLTEGSDVKLNLNGTNYITWANGGVWPALHSDYGFIQVDWNGGRCRKVEVGISPFFIFVVPAAAILVARTPINKVQAIHRFLNKRVPGFTEYSLGGGFLVAMSLLICAVVAWSTLTAYPELTTAITATGMVAIMGFWMALLPSSKTSFFVWLTNIPFERSIKYHKNVVGLAMTASFVHLVLVIVKDMDLVTSGDNTYWKRVIPLNGLIAFLAFSGMTLFAFEPIRRARYEVFLLLHQLYPVGIVFLVLHVDYVYLGFLPGALFHLIDIGMRLYAWITPTRATVTAKEDIVSVEIKGKRAKYELGCYYFLNIPEVGLMEWHPFSVSQTNPFTIKFHIKALGPNTWTRRLYDKVKALESGNANPTNQTKVGDDGMGRWAMPNLSTLGEVTKKKLRVCFDGPYGTISLRLTEYSSISILVGGIGITPMISILEGIRANRTDYHEPLIIDVHWSIRGLSMLSHFDRRIRKLLFDTSAVGVDDGESVPDEANIYSSVPIHFNLYVTSKTTEDEQLVNRELELCRDHPHFTITSGRPRVDDIIAYVAAAQRDKVAPSTRVSNATLSELASLYSTRRGCLLICGPAEMTKQASTLASAAGIDFHAETFSF